MIWVIALAWFAVGIGNSGVLFAYYHRKYALVRREAFDSNRGMACAAIAMGPFGVIATLISGQYGHGWLWAWSRQARKEAGA